MDTRTDRYHLLTQGLHHGCDSAHQLIKTGAHESNINLKRGHVLWIGNIVWRVHFCFFLCKAARVHSTDGPLGFGLTREEVSRFLFAFLFDKERIGLEMNSDFFDFCSDKTSLLWFKCLQMSLSSWMVGSLFVFFWVLVL